MENICFPPSSIFLSAVPVTFLFVGFMKMGIRKKISLGFVVIGTILLFSSFIAIYELVSMRKSVSNLVSDNIVSINTSGLLLEVTDEYNFGLLNGLGNSAMASIPEFENDTRFSDYIKTVKESYTTVKEKQMADSVLYAYTSYVIILKEAPYIWQGNYQERRNWYFNRLYPVYMTLRGYIQKLIDVSHEALAENSRNMRESFYRSIMPGVVAVGIGIVLIFLFNYFVYRYFIAPVLAVTKGISDYLSFNKSYNVQFDSNDELQELNRNVKELADTNKNLTKEKGLRG